MRNSQTQHNTCWGLKTRVPTTTPCLAQDVALYTRQNWRDPVKTTMLALFFAFFSVNV